MLKKLFIFGLLIAPLCCLGQSKPLKKVMDDKQLAAESAFIEGMKEYMAENYAKSAAIFTVIINKYEPTAGIYHMLAKSYLELSDLNRAAEAAKSALELAKENAYYQKYYASILGQQYNYREAIDLYKKVIKSNPFDVNSYILLGEIYINQEEYDQAIKLYNQVEKNIGPDEEISNLKQMLYLKQNKVDEAIKEGDRLIENQPLDPEYVLKQAQIMIGNQKLSDAQKLLINYLEDDPNLAEGHVLLADIYRRQGDLEACNKELQLAFDNKDLEPEIKLKILESYNKLTQDSPSPENLNSAIELTQKLIDMEPELAGSYVYMGDLLMRKGSLIEARENYLESTKYDKSVFEVWLALVELDTKLNDTDALVKDAQDASDYFPNQAFFWYHYGYGNVLKKDYNEAIYALEEAKALAFDNVELSKHISSLLGDSFHATKRYTEAYKAYDQVLELDPNYAPALNNYSYFLAIEKKDLDKAQLLSERLYSLDPDNIEYIDTYGWVLFQKGDYDAAKAIIEKAVKNHTELNGTILEHYGDILYKLGDASLAHEQWKKAKELGENSIHIDSKILKKQYIE